MFSKASSAPMNIPLFIPSAPSNLYAGGTTLSRVGSGITISSMSSSSSSGSFKAAIGSRPVLIKLDSSSGSLLPASSTGSISPAPISSSINARSYLGGSSGFKPASTSTPINSFSQDNTPGFSPGSASNVTKFGFQPTGHSSSRTGAIPRISSPARYTPGSARLSPGTSSTEMNIGSPISGNSGYRPATSTDPVNITQKAVGYSRLRPSSSSTSFSSGSQAAEASRLRLGLSLSSADSNIFGDPRGPSRYNEYGRNFPNPLQNPQPEPLPVEIDSGSYGSSSSIPSENGNGLDDSGANSSTVNELNDD